MHQQQTVPRPVSPSPFKAARWSAASFRSSGYADTSTTARRRRWCLHHPRDAGLAHDHIESGGHEPVRAHARLEAEAASENGFDLLATRRADNFTAAPQYTRSAGGDEEMAGRLAAASVLWMQPCRVSSHPSPMPQL